MLQLIGFVWNSQAIGFIAIPFFTLYSILRFLNWTRSTARGEREETLRHDYDQIRQLGTRYRGERDRGGSRASSWDSARRDHYRRRRH